MPPPKKKPSRKKTVSKKKKPQKKKKQEPVTKPQEKSETVRQVRVPFRKRAPYKARYYLRKYTKKRHGKIFTYICPLIKISSELILILGWSNKTSLKIERYGKGIYVHPVTE